MIVPRRPGCLWLLDCRRAGSRDSLHAQLMPWLPQWPRSDFAGRLQRRNVGLTKPGVPREFPDLQAVIGALVAGTVNKITIAFDVRERQFRTISGNVHPLAVGRTAT